MYSDADWASGEEIRKSTSGGIILNGSHYIKSWSKTQSLVALSSAESGLYALVKASADSLEESARQAGVSPLAVELRGLPLR